MGNVYQLPKPVSAVEPDSDSQTSNVSRGPYYVHGAEVPKTPAQTLDEKLVKAKLNHINKKQREELEHLRYVVAQQFRIICKDSFYLSDEESCSLSLEECKLFGQRLEKQSKDHRLRLHFFLTSFFGFATFFTASFWVDTVDWLVIVLRVLLFLGTLLSIYRAIQWRSEHFRSFLGDLKKLRKFYGEDYFPYDDFRSRLKDKE